MIETYVFTTGDITEVGEWLEENAANIFDNINVTGTTLTCKMGETDSIKIYFDAHSSIDLTLDNGTSKTISSYGATAFQFAFKTDCGIWLVNTNGLGISVLATKNKEIYGFGGNTGSGGTRWVAIMDAPTFTSVPDPKEFNVTSLCPAPYSNMKVSENLLIPIWTQILRSSTKPQPIIVDINGVNYVYDGFMCLKE
jgi:hypothetical protein